MTTERKKIRHEEKILFMKATENGFMFMRKHMKMRKKILSKSH